MGGRINQEGLANRGHSSILSCPLMCLMNADQQGVRERERDRQGELYLLGISKGLIPCRCCLDGRKEKGKAIEKK